MANLTYEQINSFASRRKAVFLNDSLRKSAALLPRRVFLSYSHYDEDRVRGVEQFINDFGAGVYVDRGDDRLPKPPSPKTAEILRGEIARSPRFLVLLSPMSYQSGWIPWELGLGDGKLGPTKVAILPISEALDDEFWRTREYLGLYPRVFKPKDESGLDSWRVLDPADNKSWTLRQWLS